MHLSVACIDYRNEKILIAKRNPTGDMGGRWEFPGGKVELNEDVIFAIKREMKEEFGVDVKVGQEITKGTFIHQNQENLLLVYEVFFPTENTNEFILTEHTECKWIDYKEIKNLCFVDSDLSVLQDVIKWIEK